MTRKAIYCFQDCKFVNGFFTSFLDRYFLPVSFICDRHQLSTVAVCNKLLQYIYEQNDKEFTSLTSQFPLQREDRYIISVLVDYLEIHFGTNNIDKPRLILREAELLFADIHFLFLAYELKFPVLFQVENETIRIQKDPGVIDHLIDYAQYLTGMEREGIVSRSELMKDYVTHIYAVERNKEKYLDAVLMERIAHYYAIYVAGKAAVIKYN